MASERVYQGLVVWFPLLLMASDIWTAITITTAKHHHEQQQPEPQLPLVKVPQSLGAKDSTSVGGKFHISYCTSCSFKNSAMKTKNMLETNFPETPVLLSNYPPPTYKLMLSKVVPVIQFGGVAIALGGEHIFPRIGYAAPPAWFNTLKQNRFGAVASSWLIGNILQNALMNTGAFEVYYDGDLVFSKLQTKRFPTDEELRELIGNVLERKTAEVY